ncbi:MAG TPA: hypothetical protein VFL55_05385, partial [Acetobacteraceae bacterium]|nr:hypothetical protein [Acetobacteraceae bacterium]
MLALGEEQCTRLFSMMHEDEIKDISSFESEGLLRVSERLAGSSPCQSPFLQFDAHHHRPFSVARGLSGALLYPEAHRHQHVPLQAPAP